MFSTNNTSLTLELSHIFFFFPALSTFSLQLHNLLKSMEDEEEQLSIHSISDASDSDVEFLDDDDNEQHSTDENGENHVDCNISDDDDLKSQNVAALVRYVSILSSILFDCFKGFNSCFAIIIADFRRLFSY